jgi:peptidoglycan/xylan/chitin deacetylase (PgdA/CDA1 family)
MTLLHNRRFASWVRGHLVCRVDGVPDGFALTFDDGPHPTATPRILDLLVGRGARATFFVLAGAARRAPDVVRRMRDEGHEIAVHGDHHWPVAILPPPMIRGEIRRCVAAIAGIAGTTPIHYRPPYGLMMPGQAWYVRRQGLVPVLGDVYPEDAENPGVSRIAARVRRRLTGGSILILHDGSALPGVRRMQVVEALEIILDDAASRGLRAITVRELLALSDVAQPLGS